MVEFGEVFGLWMMQLFNVSFDGEYSIEHHPFVLFLQCVSYCF